MADGNILPRCGFLRGILAGIILVFFIFMGLSALFPLSVQKTSEPLPVVEIAPTVAQPELATTELDASVTIPVDAAPAVLSAPVTITSVAVGSDTDTATDSSNIQLGGGNHAAPVLGAPSTPLVEAPAIVATPAVEDTVTAPVVTVEIGSSPSMNDITRLDSNTDVPSSGGLLLTGQALIQNSVSEPEPEVFEVAPADVSAFEAYSVAFDDTSDLPLMSFILLASTVAEVETVAILPVSLTVAVEASNPNIAEIIASYSAMGGELVLLLPQEGQNELRKGGDPAIVPAQLDAALVGSQGVVGILDGPEGNVNQDPRMLTAVLSKLSETGHAIITVNSLDLNRASILATKNGIPVTNISHIVDVTKGAIAIIRELDKLVLQIGDKRSISIYALATQDMLFALNFWLKSNKAQLVTLAPISAAILRN